MGKASKCRSHNGFWFFHLLRNRATKFLPLMLSIVFLFVSITFAQAELGVDHLSKQPFTVDFYSLDDNQGIASTPAESRELRSCREEVEDSHTPNLKLKVRHHQFEIVALSASLEALFCSEIPSLPSTSPCKTLFSPRPPPLFSVQA